MADTGEAPSGAICIEPGCQFQALYLRPAREPWLYEGGVLSPDGDPGEVQEWTCAYHQSV